MARVNQPSAAGAALRALAAMTGQVLVATAVAQRADLTRPTFERYVGLLESVFLIHRLPPWSRNVLSRAVRHPKVYLVDTGLAAHLMGATTANLGRPGAPELGGLVETFMVNELIKQATWSDSSVRFYHFRNRDGIEVDLVAELDDGHCFPFEAKASSTVNLADFRPLRSVAEQLGDSFRHGFVVYLGDQVLSFGPRLTAVPLGCLWSQMP
jgi:uncharacterized protein